jgi:predicted permease
MSRHPDSPHPSGIQHSTEGKRLRWLADLRQDLRFTARNLARSPSFALVTALTIALGVGAATTVFTVMNGLLFRPLPVAQPNRLVAVQERRDGNVHTDNGYTAIEYARYRAYTVAGQSVVEELAGYRHAQFALRFGNDALPVSGVRASGNYFRTLGLQPALGTFFTRDDEPSVVLSYRLWQSRFNGDRQVVGSTVYLDSRPYAVAGVAPRGFAGTVVGFANDLWVPLLSRAQATVDPNPMIFPIGRLHEGVTRESAAAALQTVALQIPPERGTRVVGARLEPLSGMSAQWRAGATRYFGLILALAVLVLLIAAGNIAGMLLARSVARRREIAIRLSIGAARGRLVRQLLTETVVVFLIGAIGGVLVARFTSRVIASIQLPVSGAIEFDFNPDLRVLAFALATALVTGLVFGLAPALQSARHDLIPALKAGLGSTDARTTRGRNVFVAAQVAASVVLLVAAGLFVRALQRGLSIDRGYDSHNVVVAQTNLEPHNYTENRGRAFYSQLVARVKALPGVESVGLANIILNGGSAAGSDVTAVEPGAETRNSLFNVVDTGYRDALRVPLIAGRWFTDTDARGAKIVAVVNQEFARRLWPNANPLGKQFRMNQNNYEVIGIVRDGKYVFIGESPTIFTYLPFAQIYEGRMSLHVRTRIPAQETLDQIRTVVRDLDANVAFERANTLDVVSGISLLPQRLGAGLIGVFGLLGLLLASLGVYGVLAFQVAQRSREIGIRLALGATIRGVLGLVLRQGARLALIGAVIGIVLALAGTRYLRSFLFDVSPLDPLTFLAVPVVLMLVALLASYIPARRAARVTPLDALRAD